ncbi:unnamed protein product [Parnassius apollo]|uniref:(apollo) hypothetical protein n=1 Tax=Parnassius apollo TaxID=110799 RepID=A0A8S3XBD1_PARAO|nr:unnamed protein product [Parnassius apollo]
MEQPPRNLEQMRSILDEAILETRSTPLENRPRLPHIPLSKRNRAVARALNPMLVTYLEASRDLCETDSILFGAALAVCRIIGAKLPTAERTTAQSSAIPAWRTRIEERIAKGKGPHRQTDMLQPDITQKLTERIDDLKQKIAAWGKRIRRFTERSGRFNQNRLFQSDQKRLYKSLERPKLSGAGPGPDQADTIAFWRGLWSEPVNHSEGPWTEVVASQGASVMHMDPVTITPNDVAEAVRRASNWKSPGLDGLHHYWLKGFVVCQTTTKPVFIACSSAAKLNKAYLPPNYAQTSGGSSDFLQPPLSSTTSNLNGFSSQRNDDFPNKDLAQNEYNRDGNGFVKNGNSFLHNQINAFENYETRSERPRAALERNAAILRLFNNNDGQTYSYAFETENGIYAEENGVATNGVEAQGSYSYTGDDGQVYSVRYTAGQNGFVPKGDHLPTSPPISQEILLALEQNARDEAEGIYDDGSYDEYKYSNGGSRYDTPVFGNSNTNGNHVNKINDHDAIVINSAFNPEVFGQQGTGVRNANNLRKPIDDGVTKAYLPPISEQRTSGNQNEEARFGSRNRQPGFTPRNSYNY